MATIYPELRKETNKRGEAAIRIVIVVDRKPSRIASGYYVEPKYWDTKKLRIKPSHPQSMEYNHAIDIKIHELRSRYAKMDAAGSSITSKKLSKAAAIGDTFLAISKHFSNVFRKAGKIGTADRYDSIANQVHELFPGIRAKDMDRDWVDEYRAKLKEKRQAHNTIVGKLKNIHGVLDKATVAGFITANNMAGVPIGSFQPAHKESLSMEELEQLWNYQPKAATARLARNAWLFSYYTTGARFKDVLLMPKSALYMSGNVQRLRFVPHKTKDSPSPKTIDVEVSPRLKQIIDEMRNDTPTILGVVDPKLPPHELDRRIDVVQAQISEELKNVIAKAGIGKYITFHCARVTLLRHLDEISNRELLTIKDAAGHSKTQTTEGYLGKDQRAIDRLTRKLYGVHA